MASVNGDFNFGKVNFTPVNKAHQRPISSEAPDAGWQPQGDALSVNFAPQTREKSPARQERTADNAAELPVSTPQAQASRVPTILSMDAISGINGIGAHADPGAIQGINGILSASGEGFSSLSGRQYTFN